MNPLQHDPLSDYFTSEWAQICPLPNDFSAVVLKKIMMNRQKEGLFNLACLSIAFAGVAASVLFVYPGYTLLLSMDWRVMATDLIHPFSNAVHEVGYAFNTAFRLKPIQPEGLYMRGLFTYIVLLASALWGVDGFLRKLFFYRSNGKAHSGAGFKQCEANHSYSS